MKLCIIASGDYFSSYGGGQVYVKNLVKGLQERGDDITVVSLLQDETVKVEKELKEDNGIPVWQIKIPLSSIALDRPFELQDIIAKPLGEIFSKIKPDIVHANGWKYAASKVCKERGIPCVVTAHHGGIVCPNGMLMNADDAICTVPASMENCLKCALHFVPGGDFWSPVVQALPEKIAFHIGRSLKNIRNIPYVSHAFKQPLGIHHKLQQMKVLTYAPDRLIAPSRAIASALVRNGVAENKVTVIPHGIVPFEKKPLEAGLPKRVLRFGYVGRISYVKGLHVVIEALALLPKGANYALHIYGDAATKSERRYRDALKEKSKDLPVIWHGKVNYEDIARTYSAFDVMLLPSIYLEVFGLTVLESFSSGRPVIATRCGGPEDTIIDDVDGVLVEPNSAEALAAILKKCIDEVKYVEELASNISKVNTLERHLVDLEKIYEEIHHG